MLKNLFASLMLGLGCSSPAMAASATGIPSWLVGAWTAASDEDGSPPDVFLVKSDGTYVTYGFNCAVASATSFHLFSGDMYVTYEVPGKGPTAIVFRPSSDKKQLVFTSPRTRHNAIYVRIVPNPCEGKLPEQKSNVRSPGIT